MKNQSHPNLCEINLPAMGGEFIYRGWPQPHFSFRDVQKLFEEAHQQVLRIEKKFTEFHKSDLTPINENAGKAAVEVDEEMCLLLEKSSEYFKKSNGLFDPTYATYMSRLRNKDLSEGEKERLRSLVNFSNVSFDRNEKTIFLPHKDMKIGFGGIGKGYAVDCAHDFLKNSGVVNFSVNGSGDMRVHSLPDAPRPWKIGIRNPFSKNRNQSAGLIQLREGSVSTSGTYVQGNHILAENESIDETRPISTTVFGETCMDTDVWGTISMTVRIKEGLRLLNENNLFGVLIDKTGKTYLSKRAVKNFERMKN
ncbi:MAG: FAD:protein FMN transferase [Halobacteriovoraceae bacterium]|nr:FAD:protein FMN transferase [Halobacteriovoraceae bacterium]